MLRVKNIVLATTLMITTIVGLSVAHTCSKARADGNRLSSDASTSVL